MLPCIVFYIYVKPHLAWPKLCLYIDNCDMYDVLLVQFVFRFNSAYQRHFGICVRLNHRVLVGLNTDCN